MANENKSSTLDASSIDQLLSKGLIGEDTHSEFMSKIAPPVMSEMSPEQNSQIPVEVVPPKVEIPSYAGTPRDENWVAPFSPEAKKAQAAEAAQKGDLDTANKLVSEYESISNYEQEAKNKEAVKSFKKFENDLKKAQKYNESAEKYGFAKIPEPTPESYGIEKSKTAATDIDMVKANEPTVAEVQAAAAPARAIAAQAQALQNEQANAAKKQAEQALKEQAQADLNAAQVSKDIENDKSDDISPWRRGFAIMLGAIGQGFAGGENLGLKAVQRLEDQIIEKKKYNEQQKKELRKQLLEEAQFKLKEQEAKTDSVEKQMRIRKLSAEIQKLQLENNAAMNAESAMKNSTSMSQDELFTLDPKVQETFVRLPDGKFAKTTGKPAADKLREYMAETGTVVPELMQLRQKIGSADFSKLSLQDRADVQTKLSSLVGALRLPIVGPGPMTETERKFIISTIGDPNKFFTLPSIETAKLNSMIGTIEGRVRNQYFNAGVNLPFSKEERIQKEVDLLQKQNPDVPRAALEAIRRKNKGQ